MAVLIRGMLSGGWTAVRASWRLLGLLAGALVVGVGTVVVATWLGAPPAVLVILAVNAGWLVGFLVVAAHLRRVQLALPGRVADAVGSQLSRAVPTSARMADSSPPSFVASLLLGQDIDSARRAGLTRYASFVLQTRSEAAMDVLAHLATGNALNMKQLRGAARLAEASDGSVLDQRVRQLVSRFPLVVTGRVLAQRDGTALEKFDAAKILAMVRRYYGDDAMDELDRTLLVEAYLDAGELYQAEKMIDILGLDALLPVQSQLMRANLRNPWLNGLPPEPWTVEEWSKHINAALAVDGLEPVSLAADGSTPLDRLRVAVDSTAVGPLVTVIMPTHNPGPELDTAVQSVLAQTWRNLELVIVDDGSEPNSRAILDRCLGSDDRVRVIRQRRNAGTYVARNRGLAEARGELVTVHDDDDWSHPRKIQIQAEYLRDHPAVVACLSLHARASAHMAFVRINHIPTYAQPNLSSLMFRRDLVLQSVGWWDTSRRSADAEFRHRIESVLRNEIPIVGSSPTSFTRWGAPSLTGTDVWRGFMDDRRRLYAWSYRAWHESGPHKVEAAKRPPFPLPAAYAESGVNPRYDLVLAADVRTRGHEAVMQHIEAEAHAALGQGLSVGILHVNSPENLDQSTLGGVPRRLADMGADLLGMADEYVCPLLVARDPAAAQFLDGATAKARFGRVLVISGSPIASRTGEEPLWNLEACVGNVRRTFGVAPLVAGDSPFARQQLRRLLPLQHLAPFEWNAPLVDGRPFLPRVGHGERSPVLGRDSSGRQNEWPLDPDDFRRAYSTHERRLLGDPTIPVRTFGEAAVESWHILPADTTPIWDFVRSIDFWVSYPRRGWGQTLSIGPLAAMASGCLVVLPPEMRDVYGEGALYTAPSDVPRLVDEIWRNPERYARRARLARQWVEEKYGAKQYLSSLHALLKEGSSALGLPTDEKPDNTTVVRGDSSARRAKHA